MELSFLNNLFRENLIIEAEHQKIKRKKKLNKGNCDKTNRH